MHQSRQNPKTSLSRPTLSHRPFHLQRASLHPPRQEIGRQSGHPHIPHTTFTMPSLRKLPGPTHCSQARASPLPILPHPLPPHPLPPHPALKKVHPPGLPLVRHMYPPLSRRFTRCRRPPLRRVSTPPSRTSIQPSLGHPLQVAHTTSLRSSMRIQAHLRNLTGATPPICRSTNV